MSDENAIDARLKLNLFENSISFIEEAVNKAQNAQSSHRSWKFAILHASNAIELTLKEILRREHPFFIYDDIDNPKKTVGVDTAVKRLESVLKKPLSKNDIAMIKEVKDLRNSITHFEVDFSIEKIRIQFSQMVGFLHYLHESYLNHHLIDNLPHDQFEFILQNQSFVKELEGRALQKIKDEGIHEDDIVPCPYCSTRTVVVGKNNKGICYICQLQDHIEKCAGCEQRFTECEMEDISDSFEYSSEGGMYTLENDYGYSSHKGCVDCIYSIQQDIKDQKEEEENESKEMDYYYKAKSK